MFKLYILPPTHYDVIGEERRHWTAAIKRSQDPVSAFSQSAHDEEDALHDLAFAILEAKSRPSMKILPERLHPFIIEIINKRIEDADDRNNLREMKRHEALKSEILGEILEGQVEPHTS